MADHPIVRMTLYKHGIGFFERRADAPGESISLDFAREAMNDVLKSLTVVAEGGQVLGVDYQTPEDKAALLERAAIHLSDDASLRDLVRDMRGRRVGVTTSSGSYAGIAVGIDLPGEREPMDAAILSVFMPERREVIPVRLADIRSITLHDERAGADLGYVLDTSLTEEDRRAVTVRLSRGARRASISYIAPSPVWRVSYRLVVDESGEGQYTAGLLQGWALFDNTLNEDLDNVQLTFVAGMPVSFVYDLYTPFTPERPVVHEEARGVAAPVEFEAAMDDSAPRMASMRAMAAGFGEPAQGKAMARPMRATAADLAASTAVAATAQAQGEFFSYAVANPMSVRRGRSAMAPILQASVDLAKERLYNGRKHPRHPVIALRFRNTTGLTLERGPLTVIEAGEYAGEAMSPFTASDGEIYLAYAVDLDLSVTEEHASERKLEGIRIDQGLLLIQEWDIQAVTYRLENRNRHDAEVTIEHLVSPGYEPFDTPPHAARTNDLYRYAVRVRGGATATFVARQRRLVSRREEIRKQNLAQLAAWLRGRVLDKPTHDRLRAILKLYDEIAAGEESLRTNAATRQKLLDQQKVIQGNLASLRDTGEEGQLRTRYARTLAEQEDRLAELDRSDAAQHGKIEGLAKQIEAAIAAL